MTRITAERITELKRQYPRDAYSHCREHHPFGHIAYSTIDIHELLDALESAYAELDSLSAQGGEDMESWVGPSNQEARRAMQPYQPTEGECHVFRCGAQWQAKHSRPTPPQPATEREG